MKDYTLANTAYDGYCDATGNKSLISGAVLPAFCELSQPLKDAWYSAARAVALTVERDILAAVVKGGTIK